MLTSCSMTCWRWIAALFLLFVNRAHGASVEDTSGNGHATLRDEDFVLVQRRASTIMASNKSSNEAHTTEKACSEYPGQRMILAAVDADYIRFFENWLLHAGNVLDDKERIVALAEDEQTVAALQALRDGNARLRNYEILKAYDQETTSLVQVHQNVPPVGTQEYRDLMHRRPGYLLRFVEQGCNVLLADVDAVWLKNPFDDIAAAGEQDLYFVDDGHRAADGTVVDVWFPGFDCKLRRHNFCGGFVYARASSAGVSFVRKWSSEALTDKYTTTGNQPVMNDVLCEQREDVHFAVLPREKFPIGTTARDAQNPTVVHANWIGTHPEKIAFMKELGLWNVSDILED